MGAESNVGDNIHAENRVVKRKLHAKKYTFYFYGIFPKTGSNKDKARKIRQDLGQKCPIPDSLSGCSDE